MPATALRCYLHENRQHGGRPAWEWLLEAARHRGVAGGSAFRAIAAFGRHRTLSEQHFFELAGQSTVLVEFILDGAQADALLALVAEERIPLFWVRHAVDCGTVG